MGKEDQSIHFQVSKGTKCQLSRHHQSLEEFIKFPLKRQWEVMRPCLELGIAALG